MLAVLAGPAGAAETCLFTGTADHAARATIRTEAADAGGLTTVRVVVRLEARPWWLWTVQILAEEISTWRGGELQSVALNSRYGVNGTAKRQQWDVLARTPAGLVAHRVQSKSLAEFQRRHPAFAGHWDPAQFAQPWLADYPAAQAERRPDLDLAAAKLDPGLRTPLALAFYWTRFLPPGTTPVPVFLPGWKRDARVDEAVSQAAPGRWRMALQHPALQGSAPSWIDAEVAPDHTLQRLAFQLHAPAGDAAGTVTAAGCASAG